MKAIAVFPETREIKLIDQREPEITAPTQVMLRVLEVGVCGTDRNIASFQFGAPPTGCDYLVIGHEMLGEVIETGPLVRNFKPGDLVVNVVRHPCIHDHCRPCRVARQDFCCTGDYTEHGIKEMHGFMTEMVVDDERYMHLVPGDLRDVGVLTEPLTVAEKGLGQVWQIQQRLPWIDPKARLEQRGKDLRAVVLGAGPVGLLGAMLLITAGFETYVYSRASVPNFKAELVEEIGATYISSQTTSVEQLGKMVGSIDLVYEASGVPRLTFDVMRVLGNNAIFISTGVPDEPARFEIDGDRLLLDQVLKNQVILGTVNADQAAFEAAIRDLGIFKKRWPHAMGSLITGRHAIEQAPQLLLGSMGGIKNIVVM